MQRKQRENSLPVISLQKARIVSDTAVVTLVIRSAFLRESTNQRKGINRNAYHICLEQGFLSEFLLEYREISLKYCILNGEDFLDFARTNYYIGGNLFDM